MKSPSEIAAHRLLETLYSMISIKSHDNLKTIKSHISNYIIYLPGHITPQKYVGVDYDTEIDYMLYGRIMESTITKFDQNWPLHGNVLDPLIKKLFVIDGAPLHLLFESLVTLTTALKEATESKKISVLSFILQELVKSDAVFSGILDACKCRIQSAIQQEDFEQVWCNTVQILISLPNRVANKVKHKLPDIFVPQVYAEIVTFHITRAISFMIIGLQNGCDNPNIKVLSTFISKFIQTTNLHYLKCLVYILSDWCNESRNGEKCFVQCILKELDTPSIERIALLFLQHCDSKVGVLCIFGNLITDSSWKYILTTKIPLMTYYQDENLMINLISYLSQCSNDNCVLKEVLIKLLDVWSDKSALNHTSVEQHIYITKLIILSVTFVKEAINQNLKETCQRLLFSGISVHLESTNVMFRGIGMITGEIVTDALSKIDNAPNIKFEYESMPTDVSDLIVCLRKLADLGNKNKSSQCRSVDSEYSLEDANSDLLGDKRIHDLGLKYNLFSITQLDTVCKQQDSVLYSIKVPSEKVATDTCEMMQKSKIELDKGVTETNLDLDSDDDLTPYDLSSDIKTSEKLRPLYLRDLRDNLINEQTVTNPDIFLESLQVAEELILAQLPTDDISFGIELLQIFFTLKQSSYVENFEMLIFNVCIAIVTTFPKECAEYLCHQLYAEMGQYSLSQQLLFLDILAESARRLSKIPVEKTKLDNTKQIVKKKAPEKAVSLFIDTEKTKKYQVICTNDDFDDFLTVSNVNIDWREIVDQRIESNTKRFAHAVKLSETFVNKFANVASYFFYPLIYGFARKGASFHSGLKSFEDQANTLLLRFLKTLSAIVIAAQNCLAVTKMGKEVLDLTWTLKYHNEAKVRLAVIETIAAVLIAVPKQTLVTELLQPLTEVRLWLFEISENAVTGDHNTECRILGRKVLSLIDLIVASDI